MLNVTPTTEVYDELQHAFNHFNRTLFNDALPPAIITLHRERKSYGYFSAGRFVRLSGEAADEIAMNPAHFAAHPMENTLSTLVHEMVHQWQHHLGKPGRRSYHNSEWSQHMEAVGLMPSNTGSPGGKRTGEKMDHYIIEGAPFALCCADLLGESFRLSWLDRFAIFPKAPQGIEIPPALAVLGVADTKPGKRVGNRVKYRCPRCQMQAWGKPGLVLLCGACAGEPLRAVEDGEQGDE